MSVILVDLRQSVVAKSRDLAIWKICSSGWF